MRRRNSLLFKILIGGAMAAALGFAQRGGGGGGGGRGGGEATGFPMGGTRARLDILSAALNLNKDQKKSVKTLLDDTHKEAAPLRQQIAESRTSIGGAIATGKSGDELKPAVDAYSVIEAKMAALEMKAFGQIYATLDDTQKGNQNGVSAVFLLMHGFFRNKNWNEE